MAGVQLRVRKHFALCSIGNTFYPSNQVDYVHAPIL